MFDEMLFSTTRAPSNVTGGARCLRAMNSTAEPVAFDIVARIAECAPELRSAERKVAALILDDLTGASRASIGALAERAQVSVATVTQ